MVGTEWRVTADQILVRIKLKRQKLAALRVLLTLLCRWQEKRTMHEPKV
jgi:hypothetical protein